MQTTERLRCLSNRKYFYYFCSTSWIRMVSIHSIWVLKKMATPMEFSCSTAMQWVKEKNPNPLYFLNMFCFNVWFVPHSDLCGLLALPPFFRCHLAAHACSDVSHHWGNSGLLHGFGSNARARRARIHRGTILPLQIQSIWVLLLLLFVCFVLFGFHLFAISILLLSFLADWTTSHAALLGTGIPVMPLRVWKWHWNRRLGGRHEKSQHTLCMSKATEAWISGFELLCNSKQCKKCYD